MPKYFQTKSLLLLLMMAPSAFAATFTASDKGFIHSGAGAFVGQVVGFQISTNSSELESGTVQMRVTQIVSGDVPEQFVTLSYSRTLTPITDEADWDLIGPKYTSLRSTAIGKKYLIFFSKQNGEYIYAPGDNAVQDVAKGLFVGRIRDRNSLGFINDLQNREVQVEIQEMILGWLDGQTLTLPIDSKGCPEIDGLRNRTRSDPSRFSGLTGSADDLLLITFDEKGICRISKATDKVLKEIKELDSQ